MARIHILGILLFLFIPLVLFLFLKHPFGVITSFIIAIVIMISHRFVAIPFMNRFKDSRCLWCGRTSRPRVKQTVGPIEFEFCEQNCITKAKKIFDFCSIYTLILRVGIFIPLAWYVITMILTALNLIHFPKDWNHFIFQFFIAITVVSISFLYRIGKETDTLTFPFPIHNLFLLGIQNTLIVFRLVGIWWIVVSLIFLLRR
ncbi:hypothetical protein L0244_12355 [bacterium]|nr:hypothetical protein [bacterium]MCI0613769.1 hypothetical protein [bacterium]